MYIFAVSGLNVYGIILAGWASNSKYAMLGSLRSAAQFISYEVPLGFILVTVALCAGSLNILDIVYAQSRVGFFCFSLAPHALIFLFLILAETNRAPFDLPEAEAEPVAGFNVEYSSIAFAFFFLGEYCSMLLMSTLFSLFFLGGWLLPFFPFEVRFSEFFLFFKSSFIFFFLIYVRANYPRLRYDQLMYLC